MWGRLQVLSPLGHAKSASPEAPLSPEQPLLRERFELIVRTQKWPGQLSKIEYQNMELTPLTSLSPMNTVDGYSRVTATLLRHKEAA